MKSVEELENNVRRLVYKRWDGDSCVEIAENWEDVFPREIAPTLNRALDLLLEGADLLDKGIEELCNNTGVKYAR